MELVLSVIKYLVENYQVIIAALVALLSGVVAVALIIPGDQPERFLQSVVDFLKKFSNK